MRYIWLMFLSIFIVTGAIFAYQNQDPVALRFNLDWINIRLGFSARPVFIPIFLSLAVGMFITALYLFGHHMRLRLQIRMQKSEIYRLKKLVILERDKHPQLGQKKQSSPKNPPPLPESLDSVSSDTEEVLASEESENLEIPSSKS